MKVVDRLRPWPPRHLPRRVSRCCADKVVLVVLVVASCGGNDFPDLFSAEVDEIVIEVDYQEGAVPYTQADAWSLFAANAQALFATSPRRIIVPQTVEQMQLMEDVSQEEFTTLDLIEISKAYQDRFDTSSTRVFHVLFLNGYLANEGRRSEDVIGVSVEGAGIIALFKPVLLNADNPLFVEQSSLVHEFGHAVGLVNVFLPLTSDHHDVEHGAHCTNRDCVMYYLHEGRADLMQFYRRYRQTNSAVMFGSECLDDAWAAAR